MNNENNIDRVHDDVFNSIKILMEKARNEVAREVNNILVQTYWEIGRIIVEDEQGHSERAEYGRELLKDLSKRLTKEFGRGFSVSNLQFMRRFFPIIVNFYPLAMRKREGFMKKKASMQIGR